MQTDRMETRPEFMRRGHYRRRGVVSLWTLLMVPVLLVMFAVVVEGVHLWLARVELENALEAGALAAVKEWAESGSAPGSGWTAGARDVGVDYAAANTINQTPVDIDDNFVTYSEANPNENESCQGDLIFGAITEEDPYVFEADQVPSCMRGGRGLVDVTSNNMDSDDNSWGISFPTEEDAWFNDNVLIDKIVIDVDPNDEGDLRFDFTTSGLAPILSANAPNPMVEGVAPDASDNLVPSEQHDNFGFVGWIDNVDITMTSPFNPTFTAPDGEWPGPGQTSPQIEFYPTTGTPTVLTIRFNAYKDALGNVLDPGFKPGDRFRFGAGVRRNGAAADGDDIGKFGVKITVFFKDINDNPLPPEDGVTGYFTDTEYGKADCADGDTPGEWEQDDLGNWHLLVHPIRLEDPDATPLIARDLPCPHTAAPSNDKQSIVLALGTPGVGNYAVRAQSRHRVPSLICSFLGIDFGTFYVSACTTAMYDCALLRPRLIRVEPENFYCTDP